MESSIESTIEKIKLQEYDNEAKLQEKRTYEAKVVSLNRGFRDALSHASKLKHDHQEALARVDELKLRCEKEKSRRDALSSLLKDMQNELKVFQEKSIQGVSTVRNLRSQLCKSVQNVSDQCDVWALFTKPKSLQLPTRKVVHENIECTLVNSGYDVRLQNAIERRTMLQAERNRLQSEPYTGNDFLRIKNALLYCKEYINRRYCAARR